MKTIFNLSVLLYLSLSHRVGKRIPPASNCN